MIKEEVDILLIGGGVIGAAFMLAMANSPYRMLMVENKPLSPEASSTQFDARSLALSTASITILDMLAVWPMLKERATRIQAVHVSERSRFGRTLLQAKDDEALGYVVEMQDLQAALYAPLLRANLLAPARLIDIDVAHPEVIIEAPQGKMTIKTRLIVAADGTDSSTRHLVHLPAHTKEYSQHAVIANIGLKRSHHHCAYERFTSEGPIALLPMQNHRAALVWTQSPAQAQKRLIQSEASFLHDLQKAFGYRLGRFTRVGERAIFPLRQVIMPEQAVWPLVFVGNAAHTLHPVAGQGFNLSLRDIAALAQCITHLGLDANMLKTYQSIRHHDQMAITRSTDGLIELFNSRIPGIRQARTLGMLAMDQASILKSLFTHYARGFAGITPDLACGIPLSESCDE